MRFYLAFDDTDTIDAPRGTGKLARRFEKQLPEGCTLWGVVRQQLLVHEDVPYTSHNSAACLVIEAADVSLRQPLLEAAVEHLEGDFYEGSDPGLCLAAASDHGLSRLMDFGQRCSREVVHKEEALQLAAAVGVHLSAHGGTGDGVIGALAGVGLTAWGWAGRCIEFGGLRSLPDICSVARLEAHGILVASIDRDAPAPAGEDVVRTHGWCRPRLLGGRPVLLAQQAADGAWDSLGRKRRKQHGAAVMAG